MRYSYEFKRKAVELYKQGKWIEPPDGMAIPKGFHDMIRRWAHIHQMLERAFKKFPSVEGLIFHSDQGWQYQHAYYTNELKEHGIIQSMSRKGNCYDNCIMETFFGRMKNEMYYGYEKDYSSFEEFNKAVEEYVEYYNNKRIQAKTKWMPPVKYREASMCSA